MHRNMYEKNLEEIILNLTFMVSEKRKIKGFHLLHLSISVLCNFKITNTYNQIVFLLKGLIFLNIPQTEG
jgi:hypothetical protein